MGTIKYYPLSRIQTGLYTRGNAYTVNGKPYTGAYYLTYDGNAYTGTNPTVGSNQLLTPIGAVTPRATTQPSSGAAGIVATGAALNATQRLAAKAGTTSLEKAPQASISKQGTLKQLTPYYPIVTDADYTRGYFRRYFAKRIADKGYIMEISVDDWNLIKSGDDPTYLDYEVEDMMWQLTGPLKDTRVSQYQIKGGVETTNKRITEQKTKTFIGLVEFIGGDYTKFARIDK